MLQELTSDTGAGMWATASLLFFMAILAVCAPPGWYDSLQPALAEARQTGKPIFLVFRCDP